MMNVYQQSYVREEKSVSMVGGLLSHGRHPGLLGVSPSAMRAIPWGGAGWLCLAGCALGWTTGWKDPR